MVFADEFDREGLERHVDASFPCSRIEGGWLVDAGPAAAAADFKMVGCTVACFAVGTRGGDDDATTTAASSAGLSARLQAGLSFAHPSRPTLRSKRCLRVDRLLATPGMRRVLQSEAAAAAAGGGVLYLFAAACEGEIVAVVRGGRLTLHSPVARAAAAAPTASVPPADASAAFEPQERRRKRRRRTTEAQEGASGSDGTVTFALTDKVFSDPRTLAALASLGEVAAQWSDCPLLPSSAAPDAAAAALKALPGGGALWEAAAAAAAPSVDVCACTLPLRVPPNLATRLPKAGVAEVAADLAELAGTARLLCAVAPRVSVDAAAAAKPAAEEGEQGEDEEARADLKERKAAAARLVAEHASLRPFSGRGDTRVTVVRCEAAAGSVFSPGQVAEAFRELSDLSDAASWCVLEAAWFAPPGKCGGAAFVPWQKESSGGGGGGRYSPAHVLGAAQRYFFQSRTAFSTTLRGTGDSC